jgi:hypothetical protein
MRHVLGIINSPESLHHPPQVHVAPTQWSWPLNLPLTLLGLFPKRPAAILSDSFTGGQFPGAPSPWNAEFEQAILSIPLKVGRFTEVFSPPLLGY